MSSNRNTLPRRAVILGAALIGVGCASRNPMGMVTDSESGLQYGSMVDRSLLVDASQFRNRRVKITTRNVSGDGAYRLDNLARELAGSLASKGYTPDDADGFGLRYDVNLVYSGHIQRNYANEGAWWGGATGGLIGANSRRDGSTGAGILVGATLAGIIGATVTDDTYMVVVDVTIAMNGNSEQPNATRTVTFSSSTKAETTEAPVASFREVLRTKVAVYAGGRNVSQAQIADGVRRRLVSILRDII